MRSKDLDERNRSIKERQERLKRLLDCNEDLSSFISDYLTSIGFFGVDSNLEANLLAFNSGKRYAALMLLSGLGYGDATMLKFNKTLGDFNGY